MSEVFTLQYLICGVILDTRSPYPKIGLNLRYNRLDTKVASELTIYSPKFGGVEHCALLHIIVMHMGPIISM